MRRRISRVILGTAIAGIIGAALAVPMIGQNASGATAPVSRPITVAAPCATFDVTGRPATGLPWDEPVKFCGTGIKSGTWTCPAKSPVLNPGSLLHCTKD